jgi:hypothetical protein
MLVAVTQTLSEPPFGLLALSRQSYTRQLCCCHPFDREVHYVRQYKVASAGPHAV